MGPYCRQKTRGFKNGKIFNWLSQSVNLCEYIFNIPSLQNRKSLEANILREGSSLANCWMSHVTCHVSHVRCHVSLVRILLNIYIFLYLFIFLLLLFSDKVVNLFGWGSVINGATMSSFSLTGTNIVNTTCCCSFGSLFNMCCSW